MKYYTKEWYDTRQQANCALDFDVITEDEYKNLNVDKVYQEKLNAYVEEYRLFHIELEKGRQMRYQAAGKVFIPESFDEQQYINEFMQLFVEKYKSDYYPSWLYETVDRKVIALGILPESAYIRIKEEDDAKTAVFEKINEEAQRVLDSQDIPDEIREMFYLHDMSVISFKQCNENLYELVTTTYDDKMARILFEDVQWIEKDEFNIDTYYRHWEYGELSIDGKMFRTELDSNYVFLENELYRNDDGMYEVHIMLHNCSVDDNKYLTICCGSVSETFVEEIDGKMFRTFYE